MAAVGGAPALRALTPAERGYVLWSDYSGLIRRHAALFVVVLLLGLAGGVLGTTVAPKSWAATARVLVTPTGVGVANPGGNRIPGGVNLDTEARTARSKSVLDRVAAKIGGASDLANRIDLSVPPNSGVLRFTYTDSTASSAAKGANVFAAAYLDDRRAHAEAQYKDLLERRRAQLSALQGELQKVSTGPSAEEPAMLARREVLTRQTTIATRELDQLSAVTITPGQLLSEAKPPRKPVYPDLGVWTTSGFCLGLLAAIGACWLADHAARRIRRVADIERMHGVPILATLRADAMHAAMLGHGPVAHAAAELVAVLPPGERLIAVAGASTGAPSGAAAVALAAALSRAGYHVLVVLADPEDDPLAGYLGAGSGGLSDVVLDAVEPRRIARPVPGLDRLRVIAPGPAAADAAERFGDPDEPTLDSVRASVDYAIVATGPIDTAQSSSLASRADGTVLAVELRRTSHPNIRMSVGRIGRSAVLGAIVTGPRGVVTVFDRRLGDREPAVTR